MCWNGFQSGLAITLYYITILIWIEETLRKLKQQSFWLYCRHFDEHCVVGSHLTHIWLVSVHNNLIFSKLNRIEEELAAPNKHRAPKLFAFASVYLWNSWGTWKKRWTRSMNLYISNTMFNSCINSLRIVINGKKNFFH